MTKTKQIFESKQDGTLFTPWASTNTPYLLISA